MNSNTESLLFCPVCKSDRCFFALNVKDHSVSQEFFEVFECPNCDLRFTRNAPAENAISRYYASEDYISHSNTRKGLINGLYHFVRRHTLASKFSLIEKTTGLQMGHHLDIGAGTGAFVQYMNQRGWKSAGIEPDEKARERALTHHETKLLPPGALENFLPESFDAISLWHVLEHVHDLHPYMDKIKKMLKPRGLVFIAVPNYTSFDGQKYGANWAGYDVPRHLYHFSPRSMQRLLRDTGYLLVQEVPMWWDSFYISLLSEKYTGGSGALPKGFITGALSNLKAFSNREKCSSLIYIAKKG